MKTPVKKHRIDCILLCKSNAFILFLTPFEAVNFQINHKKRLYVKGTPIFSLILQPNLEIDTPTGC